MGSCRGRHLSRRTDHGHHHRRRRPAYGLRAAGYAVRMARGYRRARGTASARRYAAAVCRISRARRYLSVCVCVCVCIYLSVCLGLTRNRARLILSIVAVCVCLCVCVCVHAMRSTVRTIISIARYGWCPQICCGCRQNRSCAQVRYISTLGF